MITKDDLEAELDRIAYTIKPGNIPLIMVLGRDLYLKDHNYPSLVQVWTEKPCCGYWIRESKSWEPTHGASMSP